MIDSWTSGETLLASDRDPVLAQTWLDRTTMQACGDLGDIG
jgi:hypothetical protein